jgi:hypothetical protein
MSWESGKNKQIANENLRTYELIGLTYVPPKLDFGKPVTKNAVDELDSYETFAKEAGC